MKYAGLINNDVVNGYDVCVSVWVQGCPFHCEGCHNPQTWDFNGGLEINKEELISNIISALSKNNVMRNLSILGGEPLCEQNLDFVRDLIIQVRQVYPNVLCFIWTGYKWSTLNPKQMDVVKLADVLIDGDFILSQRDTTLALRGSTNQRVIDIQKSIQEDKVIQWKCCQQGET